MMTSFHSVDEFYDKYSEGYCNATVPQSVEVSDVLKRVESVSGLSLGAALVMSTRHRTTPGVAAPARASRQAMRRKKKA